MIGQICQYLRNYFDKDSKKNRLPYWSGEFAISNGELVGFSNKLLNGQYFRISDSRLNDGVYKYPTNTLRDEIFDGTIQSMAVPKEIEDLADDIEEWIEKNAEAINSPYQSESWGGYSYSLRSGGTAEQGGGLAWAGQFASRLAPWRKI